MYFVNLGDGVYIYPYAMARCDWIWDNPYQFNPNRYLINDGTKIVWPKHEIFPAFNLKPRYCLGKQVAILEGKVCCKSKQI